MPINTTSRFYHGFTTGSSGDLTAGSLAYTYIAFDTSDPSRSISSVSPQLPRRPFTGDIEIEAPLPVGSAIMVIEHQGRSTLVLIDQERYTTTECQ